MRVPCRHRAGASRLDRTVPALRRPVLPGRRQLRFRPVRVDQLDLGASVRLFVPGGIRS